MKRIIKALLGGLGVSIVLCSLFPSAFLKDEARWTYQSDVGRVDVTFAGDVRDGQIDVQGKSLRVDRPQWIHDGKHNQGVVVQFPVSYLKRTYEITLKPRGNTKEMSLGMSFLGKDLRVRNRRKPAYVCFENIRVNGKTVAEERTVWHDKPFRYHVKNMSANSTVTLGFEIRKPITPSDVNWGRLIGLFVVVGLLIFYFGALRRLGNKISTSMGREDGMQCNIKDGTQRLHTVESLRISDQDEKSSDVYTLPSEYPSPAGKFKNIELLRFLMAWSVAGFHTMHVKSFAPYGLSFLVDYTGKGFLAVLYFFVVSFFFLVLKTRPDCSVWKFVRNKWLRMAPLIIVVTLIAYVLHFFGFWGWSMSANLEQCLLIHDTCPADRWSKFVSPAWFCCVLFLSSILYLSWIKTLSAKHVALVVTSIAFIGLVLWRSLPQLPNSGQLVGFIDYSRVFVFLGISYVIANVFVTTTPPAHSLVTLCRQSLTKVFVYTAAELFFLSIFVCSLYGAHWYKLSDLLSIVSFACLFHLFIWKEGYLSRLLEQDWCVWVGRYAFGIFIVHRLIFQVTLHVLSPGHKEWALAHPWCLLLSMVCAIMLLAMLGYHYIEVPVMRYIKSK